MESATSLDSRQHGNDSPLVVGYEANGGFLLGSDVVRNGVVMTALPTRDALLPMLALLSMARIRGCKLSELSLGLSNRFTASDRLQSFPTQDSRVLLDRLLVEPAAASELLAPQSGEVVTTDTTDGLHRPPSACRKCPGTSLLRRIRIGRTRNRTVSRLLGEDSGISQGLFRSICRRGSTQ